MLLDAEERQDARAERSSAAADPPTAAGGSRHRPLDWKRPMLLAVLPIALVAGLYVYATGGKVVSINDAYVDKDKVGVSTDIAGTVAEVAVRENQRVAPGQVLYRLDDLPYRLALSRAEAHLGMVRDELTTLQAGYREIQAQVGEGAVDVSFYAAEGERQRQLLAQHVASQSAFDAADRNLAAARQKLVALRQQLAGVAASLDGAPNGPVERNPKYLEAKAQRDEAARQLAHAIVRAPFAGVATGVGATTPGRFLPASTPAFFLVGSDRTWVDVTPKETELTWVRVGQSAVLKVDTYPGVTWRGVVESISPAAAQEFSLLPAQNTSGNWVKVVQRIPLRLRVLPDQGSLPPLRAGMSVVVQIDTGHARGLPFFESAAKPGARS
ncbi:MAG TPA: HlyD family secretion protein [Caulobacteraceae bacterium]